MTAGTLHLLRSYRRLYRHALYAVKYAVPARYTVRDELRRAYRSGSAADFDSEKIDRTVAFLQSATEQTGTAHKVLKNLIKVWYWESRGIIANRRE